MKSVIVILVLTAMAGVAQAADYVLNCQLASNKSEIQNVPSTLTFQLDFSGNDILAVNGSPVKDYDQDLDEGVDTVTFRYDQIQLRSQFIYGECETTKKGWADADAVALKAHFTGDTNVIYNCSCSILD